MNEHNDDGTKSLSRQRRKTRRLIVCLLIAIVVIAALGWKVSSLQKENNLLREQPKGLFKLPFL